MGAYKSMTPLKSEQMQHMVELEIMFQMHSLTLAQRRQTWPLARTGNLQPASEI